MLDVTKFVGELHEYFDRAIGPIAKRLKALEDRAPAKGDPGVNGKDGQDGQDGAAPTDEQILAAVSLYVKSNPPPKGEKGDAGQNGRDGIDGKDGIGKDGQDGKPGERGEKGLNGNDGLNAEVSYDDIVKAVADVHEPMVAKYILDLERRGMDAIQRAVDKLPTPKDGKDGINGRDGKDGLSVEGLQREYISESHEIRERWVAAGVEKELRYPAGGIHGAGYWREGVKAKASEAWTHEGTLWIALRDTSDKPAVSSKDWFIGARKGRDGNDGKHGKDAQSVKLKAANGS